MDAIEARHTLLRTVREFFHGRGYMEVETPYLMETAPPDPYIEPLQVRIAGRGPYFLHTSPEMGMKKILAGTRRNIFQISKVFRTEEFEDVHSTEFTMLEWYTRGTYVEAMEETRQLVLHAGREMAVDRYDNAWPSHRVSDLFLDRVGFDPLTLRLDELRKAVQAIDFKGVSNEDAWEDIFFALFVQEIEPRLYCPACFVFDWPASITAMAKRKDERTAERFELYMEGLEIANGYTELLDAAEQRKRFGEDNEKRRLQGKRTFPVDESLLDSLTRIRGSYAGVSIGVDRLLMVLLGKETIDEVLPFRLKVPALGRNQ